MPQNKILIHIYEKLLRTYGPQHWWPADTPFEVMLGAVLTQNTSWSNVEKAITSLRETCDLTPEEILLLPTEKLQEAIRPSGYYRQKAGRLRSLCRFLGERYSHDFSGMESLPAHRLREQFLSLSGIGPETADSILLYALGKPVFVVDAYTVRLCSRLGLCNGSDKYGDIQELFMKHLKHDPALFNEYHALIVRHGKTQCRKTSPLCENCVLLELCKYGTIDARN